HRRKQMKMH
ncbi:NH(3)-dependent NAD(+) synthetase, partial [Vibrio parahaemolyticus VPTS-2010_2]